MDLFEPLNLGAGEEVADDIFVNFLKYNFQNFVFIEMRKPVLQGSLENKNVPKISRNSRKLRKGKT